MLEKELLNSRGYILVPDSAPVRAAIMWYLVKVLIFQQEIKHIGLQFADAEWHWRCKSARGYLNALSLQDTNKAYNDFVRLNPLKDVHLKDYVDEIMEILKVYKNDEIIYLETEKNILNQLEEDLHVDEVLKKVKELDKIIDRIRTIVSQVTRGLEVMTLLILGCGVLVMFAAVSLSMSERLQESAILRTLGSSRRLILGIQLIEFSALGTMAGLLASAGAELSVAMLQRYMFDLPFSMHPWLWYTGPLVGGLLVGSLGVGYSRKAVVQPPLEVLRSL